MINRNILGTIIAAALLGVATSNQARTVQVGGPIRVGHGRPPLHVNVTPSTSTTYSPAQIRHAYGIDQLSGTGAGQKIAIVDAYGSPTVQSDLNAFCTQFGLPQTTVQILGSVGTDTSWQLETALDVQWAHAIAPNATIILSIAASSSLNDLMNAVDAAVRAGATVVSMSWGSSEFTSESTFDSHFNIPGVTFTASSGDNGAGVEWPAASPYVLGVGGTSLYLDANNNRSSESAWSGSGGGVSGVYRQPSYQTGWISASGRAVPDVSLVADPNTGMYVYSAGAWYVVGGTSASAPQWAGMIAIANSQRTSALGSVNATVYPIAVGSSTTPYAVNNTYFFDVSSGSNGNSAAPPYDLVCGIGSPVANQLVPALIGGTQPPTTGPADFSLAVSPSSRSVRQGRSTTYTASVTPLNNFTGPVSLTVSGLPANATASFNPSTITTSGSSTLSVNASRSTPSGTYTLKIVGSNGTLQHSGSVTLTVK